MDRLDDMMQQLRYCTIEAIQPDCHLETATEAMLQRFESHIGDKLPADYRLFLGKYGGISLSDHIVASAVDSRLDPDDALLSVSDFYGFYTSQSNAICSYDLFHQYQALHHHIPAEFVPFAESGDNRFCISTAPQHSGLVCCLIPAAFADEEATLYLVAHTFSRFIQSLRILRD